MSDLSPPPINSPIGVVREGAVYCTRPWLQWFAADFERSGGPSAPSNSDLESMIFETFLPPPVAESGELSDPFGGIVVSHGAWGDTPDAFADPFDAVRLSPVSDDTDTGTVLLLARIVALEQRIATLEALEGFA